MILQALAEVVCLDSIPMLSNSELSSLHAKKIFFGHQSVGADIVQGIRELMASDPRLRLRIIAGSNPESISAPAFVECAIGENRRAHSKNEAFSAILANGMGAQGGIAMYKYCYVDIDASTNVRQMFEAYRSEIDSLKRKYPLLTFVHITVPLTTAEPTTDVKALIKTVLGRTTLRDINAKRNEFNRLLKQAYSGKDPIFDLAEVESTYPDGSRSYFKRSNENVYTLAPTLTSDGGHLNEAGRRAAALRLLHLLAEL